MSRREGRVDSAPQGRLLRERAETAERALEASLKELADLKLALDASAIVAITDRHGVITYVNDRFCTISKYSREELLGRTHSIVNSGYHPKAFFKEMWSTIGGGAVWRGEIRNRAKDGTYYWVDTTIVPFLDESGRPYQYVSIRNDISERKRLESELMRAAQLSLIGELAAGLAHEVKNPLAGIQGAVDILIRRRQPSDPEREALEGVREEVLRIDATVRALLDRARPRAARPVRASLTEVVRRAVLLAQDHALATAAARGRIVPVEFDPGDEPLVFNFDPSQIEDAVLNLALNAIEATSASGEVRVRIRPEEYGPSGGPEAIVEVEDTGIGIGDDDLKRIFNPFFTTTPGGTGLGLPAVRRIARAHRGRVDAKSTPGEGSTFTIRLPLL